MLRPRPARATPGGLHGLGPATVFWGLVICACAGMAVPVGTENLRTTPALTPTAPPTDPLTATAAPADSGWVTPWPGLERRALTVPFQGLGFAETLILFRVDPAHVTLRVLYAPGRPRFVADWDRSARLVFNAGFFDEREVALGLVVSDGQRFGQSYVGLGGMLAVDALGTPTLRSLAAQPYQPDEALSQAIQSYPMLIYPDGSAFAKEDGARARRTALGQDAAGRLILLIAPHNAFTLAELGAWLRGSDLGLVIALNLDGGGSTGYYAGPQDALDSLVPVPAVVAVYAR